MNQIDEEIHPNELLESDNFYEELTKIPADSVKFEKINIDNFLNSSDEQHEYLSTELFSVTQEEIDMIKFCFRELNTKDPDMLKYIAYQVTTCKELAKDISRYPSLLHKWTFSKETRTQSTLIEVLLESREGDRTLDLPTKAMLGKAFLIAKFHSFSALYRAAKDCNFGEDIRKKLNSVRLNIMFTLMAEDVYTSLLDDRTLDIDIRREIASLLIILWEHRTDQNVKDIAPVLDKVWQARRKLAPAFGTMVGTSELLLLSIEMDEQWRNFISQKMGDPDVAAAMEEYLFGISYEKIQKIKTILRERDIAAVNRDEAADILGESIPAVNDKDFRTIYRLYTIRRDDAAARKRMNLPGPHQTLEAHYMKYVLLCNRDLQANDPSAK